MDMHSIKKAITEELKELNEKVSRLEVIDGNVILTPTIQHQIYRVVHLCMYYNPYRPYKQIEFITTHLSASQTTVNAMLTMRRNRFRQSVILSILEDLDEYIIRQGYSDD